MNSSLRVLAGACLSAVLCLSASAASAAQLKIYFSREMKDLTAEGAQVVTAVVEQSVAANATEIVIVGHTDTAEHKAMALSLARAKAVRAELLRQKLPKTIKITISGVGATQPDFPIPPKTSEPLDRVVSVTFN